MLACQEYTSAIDVWSVGCIFAELLARSPLFPGEDYIAQLRLICEKLGKPSDSELDFVTSERARRFMNSLSDKPPPSFKEMFSQHPNQKDALHLLKGMLEIHPRKRITVNEALRHPFLEALHKADDEPLCNEVFAFEFEKTELSREKVQELIWEEIKEYHPHISETFPSSAHSARRKSRVDNTADAKTSSELDDEKPAAKKRSITPNSEKGGDGSK